MASSTLPTTKAKWVNPGTGEAKEDIAALGLDQISQRASAGSSITGPIATGAPLSTNASSVATTIQSCVVNSSKSPRRGEIPQQSSHPCPQTALPTPVNVALLSRVLLGYNSRIAYRLIKGFSEGFKINYPGPRITSTAPNLRFAYENPDVADEKLRKERALGRIAGPFDSHPLANLRISPLDVIPKKTPGEFRMIHHLSYPKGASINDISIYTLSDPGVLSNLIGSLSLANEHYSPPTE